MRLRSSRSALSLAASAASWLARSTQMFRAQKRQGLASDELFVALGAVRVGRRLLDAPEQAALVDDGRSAKLLDLRGDLARYDERPPHRKPRAMLREHGGGGELLLDDDVFG
jgi:hypothetical protein